MEELRSIEVLSGEILEDARKKAAKILKTAALKIESQTAQWEEKTKNVIEEIHEHYKNETKKTIEEINIKSPMDKRRLRSETAEFFLHETMIEFLQSLKHEDLLLILEHELEKQMSLCGQGDFNNEENVILEYYNMNENEAENILKEILSKIEVLNGSMIKSWQTKAGEKTLSSFPVLIVNLPDIKITASVEEIALNLLLDKRAELASALLGMEVLND